MMTGDATIDLLIVLGFTLLVILLLLNYFYRLQARYFDLTEGALGRVDEIRVVESATFVQTAAGTERDDAVEPLSIEGSKVVPVGGASSAFKIVDELPERVQASWSVEPAGLATVVVAADTRSAIVYAASPGTLTVVASAGTGSGGEPRRVGAFEAVAAVATRSRALELPWPGRGLGTLVVILVLLAVVLSLALQGLIEGAAIAALLTAVAGFAFGVRALESK